MASRESESPRGAGLLETLVHPSLRHESDLHYRAVVLVIMLLTLNVLVVLAIVVHILSDIAFASKLVAIVLCASMLFGNSALIYVLAKAGNYKLCSLVSLLLCAAIIVSGIVSGGGLAKSPATQMLMVLPLMAYFLRGRRWGNVSVLLVAVFAAAFYALERLGVTLSLPLREADVDLTRMWSTFIFVAVISSLAFFFERSSARLKLQRDAEHKRALLLAETDATTGLCNRRSFDAQLDLHISSARDFVLFYIDLDGFKSVNDLYGHRVGDEILQGVGQRLRHIVRERDFAGRLGGDEFALLLDMNCDVMRLQQMARRTLEALSQPIATSVGPLVAGASIGIACYPQHARSGDALKKAADGAMYEAKRGHHGWRMTEAAATPVVM